MKKIKKQNGFTLLELIAVLAIIMSLIIGALYAYQDYIQRSLSEKYGRDFVRIISAVDHRMAIDGFEFSKWNHGPTWTGVTAIRNDLFRKELVARDSTCGATDGWVPILPRESRTQLVPCDLWQGRTPWNANINAELVDDGTGFVRAFNMWILFPDEVMNEKFKYVRFTLSRAREVDNPARTGFHNYDFVNYDTDRNASISMNECLNLTMARTASPSAPRCGIKISYERNSSFESLHVDGSNSMIDSSVTFKPTISSPAKTCLRWKWNISAGVYEADNTVPCGIGIHTETGYPVVVDTTNDGITSSHVLLDRLCNVYNRNASLELIDAGVDAPCGIQRIEDSGTQYIYQVVDKTSVNEAYIKYLYAQDILSDTINSKFAVISENMDIAGYLNVAKGATVGERLNVLGVANISRELNVAEDINTEGSLAVRDNIYVQENIWSKGNLIVEKNMSLQGNGIFQGDAIVQGGVIVNNNISAREVETTGIQTGTINIINRNALNSTCSNTGQLSLNSSGNGLLVCISGQWSELQ